MPFREQLELDSMDFLDIVMELRKRYRIQIPEDDYTELASMASTVQVPGAADEGHREGMSASDESAVAGRLIADHR